MYEVLLQNCVVPKTSSCLFSNRFDLPVKAVLVIEVVVETLITGRHAVTQIYCLAAKSLVQCSAGPLTQNMVVINVAIYIDVLQELDFVQ